MPAKRSEFLAQVAVLVLLCSMTALAGEKTLYTFTDGPDGAWPKAGVIVGPDGSLYGATQYGGAYTFGTVYKVSQNSDGTWTETVLYAFTDNNDGAGPIGSIAFDSVGNIYGTTAFGAPYGKGTVFKLAPGLNGTWSAQLLYAFTGGADGQQPIGGVVLDKAGNVYGTTQYGGTGCGVLFEVSPNSDGTWSEQVLHTFGSGLPDGCSPTSNLLIDAAGNLYGAATTGGSGTNGAGYVFEFINSGGSWTQNFLYSFNGTADGGSPNAIVFDTAGNIYGTAASGGGNHLGTNCPTGCGTVFQLKPSGSSWLFTRIYDFPGTSGYTPNGIAPAGRGNVFGTTLQGGTSVGTAFALQRVSGQQSWNYVLLHNFGQTSGDGIEPAGLIVHNGKLFGTAISTTTCYLCGTVWEFMP